MHYPSYLPHRQVVAQPSSPQVTILVEVRGCVKRVPGRMGDGWGYRGGALGQLKRVSMYGVLGGVRRMTEHVPDGPIWHHIGV